MATKQELKTRAKELIISNPTAGKNKINTILKAEYGEGLRSRTILQLKQEVAVENPKLIPQLYRTGGVSTNYKEIYNGWRAAGFLPFEARELTIGHEHPFDAKAVFDSIPSQRAREFRVSIIKEQLNVGWSVKQIKDNILDFYIRGKKVDPWEHIRAEYKPRKKIDFIDYREQIRKRAKAKQKRLLRGY